MTIIQEGERYSQRELEKLLYQRREEKDTVFDTFRRYSLVHFQTADHIVKLIQKLVQGKKSLSVLDIGAGDSKFVKLIVDGVQAAGIQVPIEFTWVESNPDYATLLADYAAHKLSSQFKATTINKKWQSFIPEEEFGLVLANHFVYFISTREQYRQHVKMISAIEPGGCLNTEARTKGDTDDKFIKEFHLRATDLDPPTETIETVLQQLWRIRETNGVAGIQFDYSYTEHAAEMVIPTDPNHPDFSNLIQFHLLLPWDKLAPDVHKDKYLQRDILRFVKKRDGHFFEREGSIVVRRR